MRACGIAFARLRMPYAVAALPRGGAGLRNEKTFLPFAEAFGDSAKSFCGRLRLPALCGARLFRPEARRIRDFATLPDRRGSAQPSGRPALRPFWPAPEALAGMRLLGAQRRRPVLLARDVVSARGRGKDVFVGHGAAGKSQKRTARS